MEDKSLINTLVLSCCIVLFWSCSPQIENDVTETRLLTHEEVSIPEKSKFKGIEIDAKHKQIIFVTSATWNSTVGKLQLYLKYDTSWVTQGNEIQVSFGKKGLAWGRGLHQTPTGEIEKKEGDMKAPVGVFTVGTAFGTEKLIIDFPYKRIQDYDFFVDDVDSEDYNTWQSLPPKQLVSPGNKWKSYERMSRKDHLYDLGFVVNHNINPTVKGSGSAIFFHVWRRPFSATAGCTAMEKVDLSNLLNNLNADDNPLIIQTPFSELKNIMLSE